MDLSVSQFLEFVNLNLREHNVTVFGEVTGRINRRGGVTYFTIHDQEEDASMTCMGFNSIMDKLGIQLEEGMMVKVSGYPEIWKRNGMFSFKAFQIMLSGEGTLKLQFEALKRKLEAEGLFSEEYKKPLPSFIKSVGLITAQDREAQNDFLKHLASTGISVNLYDVRVEGAQAIAQVCEAIEFFNKNSPETEVLVITRGGGSLESLSAFNSEDIARAIFASRIPVISAIGHERDVTIVDFVADVRASTPTDAAKIISQDWLMADGKLTIFINKLNSDINTIVAELENRLVHWDEQISNSMQHRINILNKSIDEFESKFALASPMLRLRQGYSIVRNDKGKILNSVKNIAMDESLAIQMHDGNVKTKRIS